MNTMRAFIFMASTALLAGCAGMPGAVLSPKNTDASVYERPGTMQAQNVQLGTVLALHTVTIAADGNQSNAAALGGGVVGALAGQELGRGGGKQAATLVAGIGGALAGHALAGHFGKQVGVQVTVKTDGGQVVAITQKSGERLAVGQRVEIVGGHGESRVLPLD